jgi:hypothetical protein
LVDRFEEGEATKKCGFAAASFVSDDHTLASFEGEGDVGEDVGVVEFFVINALGAAEFSDALEAAEVEVEGDDGDQE